MSTTYLKLFVDCLEKYQKLNDTEFGRLVRAALRYKATGAEPDDLGREALLWDGMRLDIDRDNESYHTVVEARASAGKKGAAVRWQRQKQDGKNSKCHFANGKNGQDKEEDKEKEKDITPPTPSATEGAAKNYWGFDQFWDVYPKKSAKKDAFDAWKRVDPDEGKVKRILEAVKQQKLWPQYSGENARYFPSPSKWLDGGCWDDEPLAGEEDPYAKFT